MGLRRLLGCLLFGAAVLVSLVGLGGVRRFLLRHPPRGTFDRTAVWGGVRELVAGPFEGGLVKAVLGGIDLDLREAEPTEGMALEAIAVFGGIRVVVPPAWRVDLEGTPLFAGVSDERSPSGAGTAEGPVLRLRALAVFGVVVVVDAP